MSFEDDMIEEGFYQEQDYLDYLCSEADKRIDLFDSENEGEDAEFFDTFDSDKKNEDTGFAEYKSHNKEAVNPLVHSLQEWKKRDSDEVHFWNLIWETFIRKEYYRREGDRYFSLLQFESLSWESWLKSIHSYQSWEDEHQKELNKLDKKVFSDSFIHYCDDFLNSTGNVIYLKTHNSRLIKQAGISLKNAKYDENDLDIAIWYSSVLDPSQDSILFDYWLADHKEEWENWKKVNYPYIKEFLIKNNDTLCNLIENIKSYNSLNKDIRECLSNVILHVAKDQMKDWWGLFVKDTKKKYAKAVELGHSDFFYYNTVNSSTTESFKPLDELFDNISMLLSFNKIAKTEAGRRRRPISHPNLRRVEAVLPGAFKEDLKSREIGIEEIKMINDSFQEEDIFEGFHFNMDDLDEMDSDIITDEIDHTKRHQRELLGEFSLSSQNAVFSDEVQKFIETLPHNNESYEDYEYLAIPPPIYYFCKDNIGIENIDRLADDDYRITFLYKEYYNKITFAKKELTFNKFNEWCYYHKLPTFTDYIIKYWVNELGYKNTAEIQVWLQLWRGKKWIEKKFGNKERSRRELFQLWIEHHKDEWEQYKKSHMYVTTRNAYRHLWLLYEWIQDGNYQLNDIIKLKNNKAIRSYIDNRERDFEMWLSNYSGGLWSLPFWKERNALLLPLFRDLFEKNRHLNLWNKEHPNEQVYFFGLNDFLVSHKK